MTNLLCLLLPAPFLVEWLVLVTFQRNGKLTVRLFALSMFLAIFTTATLMWLILPSETWLLSFGFIAALVNGIMLLTLPIIGRKYMEEYNIKW